MSQSQSALKLVIIIPAFNEAESIEEVLQSMPSSLPGCDSITTLVVDDGSTDGTGELAQKAGAVVIRNKRNRGLGKTMKRGIQEALHLGGDLFVTMDGDGQFPSDKIETLIQHLIGDRHADFVLCSRLRLFENTKAMSFMRRNGNRFVSWLVNRFTDQKFSDVSCGFRAFNRDVAEALNLLGNFTYTHESIIAADYLGFKFHEEDIAIIPNRTKGSAKMSANLFRYGLQALLIIFQTIRDYYALRVFGTLALLFAASGTGFLAVVAVNWLNTGRTYPFRSFVPIGGGLLTIAFVTFALALIADMISRERRTLEEIRLRLGQLERKQPKSANSDTTNAAHLRKVDTGSRSSR